MSSLGETLISSGGDKPVTIEAGNKAGSVSLEAGLSEDSAVPGGSVSVVGGEGMEGMSGGGSVEVAGGASQGGSGGNHSGWGQILPQK